MLGAFTFFFTRLNLHCMDEAERSREEMRRRNFLGLLADTDPATRWKAIESLARDGDSSVVDPIIRALGDDDWRVRKKAAWALGRIGDPRALAPLKRALVHEREGVKEMILEAIDDIAQHNRT